MSPLVSGDRRLAPPFRPTAAHDSDHVTARLGRSAAGAAFPPCGCARLRSCHRSPRPERRLPPPLRPAAAHDSDHVTARLGRSGAYRRLSALRLRTTPIMSPLASAGAAPTAAFPPCGCARLRSCHRSPRPERRLPPPLRPAAAHDSDHVTARLGRSGAYRRLSALRLRTTPIMSPLASAGAAPTAASPPCGCARLRSCHRSPRPERRLPPPLRPAAAHDSDHVTARLGRSGAYRRLSALRLRTTPIMSPLASAGAAPTAASPPCGCARLRSCHRSPRPERRLPPPLRPAAAHDSDHVTARLGRSGAYRRLSAL